MNKKRVAIITILSVFLIILLTTTVHALSFDDVMNQISKVFKFLVKWFEIMFFVKQRDLPTQQLQEIAGVLKFILWLVMWYIVDHGLRMATLPNRLANVVGALIAYMTAIIMPIQIFFAVGGLYAASAVSGLVFALLIFQWRIAHNMITSGGAFTGSPWVATLLLLVWTGLNISMIAYMQTIITTVNTGLTGLFGPLIILIPTSLLMRNKNGNI